MEPNNMRSFRHWTPRYIWNRIALMVDERQHPDAPWLTRPMIDILETWLRPNDVGLEFGSGRSTIWFARRIKHLTSVENDPEWYAKVEVSLQETGGESISQIAWIITCARVSQIISTLLRA